MTLKFGLISDIHLNCKDLVLPGGQYLIVAGDSLETGHLRRADNAKKDVVLADRYRRFIREEFAKYEKVFWIMGNHEHYHNEFFDTESRLRLEMPPNVTFLEKESFQVEDVWIFGATLWTDMNRENPLTMQIIAQGMNDFHVIKRTVQMKNGAYTSKFTPQDAVDEHKATLDALMTFLYEHKDDKVAVITHHAPSPLSINEEFKNEYHMNGGYQSDLSNLILDNPQIKIWVHGHMHDPVDYMLGGTRVLSNPRGYAGYEVRANHFDPGFFFEV